MTTPAVSSQPNSIWRSTLFAMAVALAINIVLYYVGQLVVPSGLQVMQGPGTPLEPLPFAGVVFVTAITMMVGAVVYWLLGAFITQTPNTAFIVISVLFLLISFVPPFTMSSGLTTQIILSLMHIVPAGSLIWFLTK